MDMQLHVQQPMDREAEFKCEEENGNED
jgi:hypothetical protein